MQLIANPGPAKNRRHSVKSHRLSCTTRMVSIIGGSCHKYNFCHDQKFFCDKHIFVVTKHIFYRDKSMIVMTKLFCCNKHNFVTTKLLSQAYFCHDKRPFCDDKHVFVMTKVCLSWQIVFVATNICRDKHNFAANFFPPTSIFLSQKKEVFCCDKHAFVAANTCLSWQSFVVTKMILVADAVSYCVVGNITPGLVSKVTSRSLSLWCWHRWLTMKAATDEIKSSKIKSVFRFNILLTTQGHLRTITKSTSTKERLTLYRHMLAEPSAGTVSSCQRTETAIS